MLSSYIDTYIVIKKKKNTKKARYCFRIPDITKFCARMWNQCGSYPTPFSSHPAQSCTTGVWSHAPLPRSNYISWKQPSRGHSLAHAGVVNLSGTDLEKRHLQALEVLLGLVRHGHMESNYPECDLEVGEGEHRLHVGLFPWPADW